MAIDRWLSIPECISFGNRGRYGELTLLFRRFYLRRVFLTLYGIIGVDKSRALNLAQQPT
jgi:hypothetical protein